MTSIALHPEPYTFSHAIPRGPRRFDLERPASGNGSEFRNSNRYVESRQRPIQGHSTPTPNSARMAPSLALNANASHWLPRQLFNGGGAERTLGPSFSEEEDGDDTEWVASRMEALGLNSRSEMMVSIAANSHTKCWH